MGTTTTRLTEEREKELRWLLVEFALHMPSPKTFDVAEMTQLRDDVTAMLGEIEALRTERVLLAKLSADTPQFFNPLVAMGAKELRDRILAKEPA